MDPRELQNRILESELVEPNDLDTAPRLMCAKRRLEPHGAARAPWSAVLALTANVAAGVPSGRTSSETSPRGRTSRSGEGAGAS